MAATHSHDSPTMRGEITGTFTRTVNAVDTLGWDKTGQTPIDGKFPMKSGTLIEVPPGTYTFEDTHSATGLTNWGLRGLGDSPDEVVFQMPAGRVGRPIQIRGNSRNILLENFALNQRNTWKGCVGLAVQCASHLLVKDVSYVGKQASEYDGAVSLLNAYVFDPEGVLILDGVEMAGPSHLAEYPKNPLAVFVGSESKGTVYIRNCVFKDRGESAIYASRCEGGVRIENCWFENNMNSQARIAGDNSWCKDSVFVWDIKSSDSVIDPKGKLTDWEGTTGLTFESGYRGYTGGLVENCRFIVTDTMGNSGMIKVDGSHGGVTMRDCSLHVEASERCPAVNVETPGDSHMIDDLPAKPWKVTLENVHVTHDGGRLWQHDAAVAVRDRSASFTDCCIDTSSGALTPLRLQGGGFSFDGQNSVQAREGAARYIGINADPAGWADVSDTAACAPLSYELPNAAQPEPEPEPEPMPDPTYANEARIRAARDASASYYTFTTTGPIGIVSTGDFPATPPASEGAPGEKITQNDDGTWTATGVVARFGGDTFAFDGHVTDWAVDGDATLYVNGQPYEPPTEEPPAEEPPAEEPPTDPGTDPEPEPEPEPDPTLQERAAAEGWTWQQITEDVVVLVSRPGQSENV